MLVLLGGKLIDGTGAEPMEHSVLLVDKNEIVAIGRAESTPIPPDAQVLDVRGKTVMPGLIDAHVHILAADYDPGHILTTPFSTILFEAVGHLRATLEAGVTTVRDAGGADLGVKLAVEQGLVPGPRLVISIGALAGVKIVMGTDSGVAGHGNNARELSLLADAGLSPMQAIMAATKTAAECLALEDRIGTLQAGKLADILILDGDPLVDIRLLLDKDRIEVLIKDGQVVKNQSSRRL